MRKKARQRLKWLMLWALFLMSSGVASYRHYELRECKNQPTLPKKRGEKTDLRKEWEGFKEVVKQQMEMMKGHPLQHGLRTLIALCTMKKGYIHVLKPLFFTKGKGRRMLS